jgi:hypothetical protein
VIIIIDTVRRRENRGNTERGRYLGSNSKTKQEEERKAESGQDQKTTEVMREIAEKRLLSCCPKSIHIGW